MEAYHRIASPDTSYETRLNAWALEVLRDLDFPARLASHSHLPSDDGGKLNELDSMYPRSVGQRSSIAVYTRSEGSVVSVASTTASGAFPALTRGNSNASSTDSADTGFASGLDGMRLLDVSSQDVNLLTLPNTYLPQADLVCPFEILDCEVAFSDIIAWKTHVFSHFRGRRCPTTATCFLCDEKFEQGPGDDQALAWNEMLSHLAREHFQQGQSLATMRTDFTLMKWMYSQRIISATELRRVQLCPRPAAARSNSRPGRPDLFNTPHAPMPPSTPLPYRGGAIAAGSVGFRDDPVTQQAGRRADRRTRAAR